MADALFQIAKIKIKQKDFYEANYILERATVYNITSQKLKLYRLFVEGVRSAM